MSSHNQALILELLGNIPRSRAGDFNPGLREEGTGNQHENEVADGVDGVQESFLKVEWWRHIIGDTRRSVELSRATLARLPNTEKLNKNVVGKAGVQHLADQEDVGAEGGLEHDWHVGGVEETNGVGSANTTLAGGLDGNFNTETLEVDNSGENDKSSNEVHDVGEVLAVECLVQSALLIRPSEQEVEESNDSAFELGSTASVDSSGREGLPDNRLANVSGDEERDTASKAITLLQELIKENDHESGNNKLNDEQDTDTGSQVTGLTVKASKDVNAGLAERQDDSEELLGSLVQFAIGFEVEVNVDELGSSKKLESALDTETDHTATIKRTIYITWKTMPDEIIGVIPNSMRVPLLEANIIRSQYRGSEVSEDTIPYRGIWLMTKNMSRVNC